MTTPKLTKTQKKGLAFRERKCKDKAKEAFDEELDVPEADPPIEEDLDVQAEQRDDAATLGQEEAAEEEMVADEEALEKAAKQSKNRKREEDAAVTEETTETSAKEGKANDDAAIKLCNKRMEEHQNYKKYLRLYVGQLIRGLGLYLSRINNEVDHLEIFAYGSFIISNKAFKNPQLLPRFIAFFSITEVQKVFQNQKALVGWGSHT
jgi:hypothetical protein